MEGFATHLADYHDWVLSVPAAQWTVDALKQVAVRALAASRKPTLDQKPFNQFRNYAFAEDRHASMARTAPKGWTD